MACGSDVSLFVTSHFCIALAQLIHHALLFLAQLARELDLNYAGATECNSGCA
jgi:hypothetical protein